MSTTIATKSKSLFENADALSAIQTELEKKHAAAAHYRASAQFVDAINTAADVADLAQQLEQMGYTSLSLHWHARALLSQALTEHECGSRLAAGEMLIAAEKNIQQLTGIACDRRSVAARIHDVKFWASFYESQLTQSGPCTRRLRRRYREAHRQIQPSSESIGQFFRLSRDYAATLLFEGNHERAVKVCDTATSALKERDWFRICGEELQQVSEASYDLAQLRANAKLESSKPTLWLCNCVQRSLLLLLLMLAFLLCSWTFSWASELFREDAPVSAFVVALMLAMPLTQCTHLLARLTAKHGAVSWTLSTAVRICATLCPAAMWVSVWLSDPPAGQDWMHCLAIAIPLLALSRPMQFHRNRETARYFARLKDAEYVQSLYAAWVSKSGIAQLHTDALASLLATHCPELAYFVLKPGTRNGNPEFVPLVNTAITSFFTATALVDDFGYGLPISVPLYSGASPPRVPKVHQRGRGRPQTSSSTPWVVQRCWMPILARCSSSSDDEAHAFALSA